MSKFSLLSLPFCIHSGNNFVLFCSSSWFKKKHPKLESAVMIEKHCDPYETSSVLPYLQEYHCPTQQNTDENDTTFESDRYDFYGGYGEEGFDENERDFEQFSAQLAQAGYPSSSGSIARLNELTINSIVSNASKASKTSKTSLKCKHFSICF